jgi:hypothetical protein
MSEYIRSATLVYTELKSIKHFQRWFVPMIAELGKSGDLAKLGLTRENEGRGLNTNKGGDMKVNGVLHIVPVAAGNRWEFMATWAPVGSGGSTPVVKIPDENDLMDFMRTPGVQKERIDEAMTALRETKLGERAHSIHEVWLSEDEARRYKLIK